MTRPSVLPHFRTLRGIALLATAALLLLGSSAFDATAAEPAGDASSIAQNKGAPPKEPELVMHRGCMLQSLMVLDPKFREAQAAWKSAEAQAAAEKAKDPRSAAARQAHDDAQNKWYQQEAIAEQRSECYAKLVANRFSLDALYAPPTLSKRFEELAKQIETVLKTRSALTSLAERDVEIAAQLRDAQTIHTLGQLLVAAEHLRRRGKADAAARISREADLLESEFKASLQKGRERLTKLVAEEPFAIEFNPQTLQGELKVVNERWALLDELVAMNVKLRETQSDLESTNDAQQKAAMQIEPQKVELARRQAQLQTVLDGLRQQQASARGQPAAQKKAKLQAALDAQGKLAVQAEGQYRELAQRQAAIQAELAARRQQQAVLQAKLKDLAAERSQRLGRLALNLQSMGGLHTPPDVSKRIEDRLAKTLNGRDAGTIPTVGQLLAAAEHLRGIGKSEAADRLSKEADLREKELAAMLQTAQEPPTETSGNSAQPKPAPAPAKKVIVLRLLDDKQVLVNNRGKIALDEFNGRLGKAVEQYKQQGVKADRIVVHLWAEKNVSCGRFDKLVADCRENHIQHYILKIPGTYLDPSRTTWPEEPPPIDVKFSLPPKKGGPPPENQFPPIVVRLTSKEDGSLAGIMIGGSRLTSTTQLPDRVLYLSRRPRGADPFGPGLGVEIDADEKLLFKHLAEAVAAVSARMGPNHKLVPLIGNVVPIRLPEAREEIEVIEDGLAPPRDPGASPRPNINLDNIKLDPPPKASASNSVDGHNPSMVAGIDDGNCTAIALQSDYAYACFDNRLVVIDVSQPTTPKKVGSLDIQAPAMALAVSASSVVAVQPRGVRVIDVSDPTAPRERGFFASLGLNGVPAGVAVSGRYAFVARGTTSGIWVLDIATEKVPKLVGEYVTDGSDSVGIAVSGNYVYLADESDGLYVIDVSNPAAPKKVSFCKLDDGAVFVAVADDLAYVHKGKKLHIVDISEPSRPKVVGVYDGKGSLLLGVAAAGKYAYVSSGRGYAGRRAPVQSAGEQPLRQKSPDRNAESDAGQPRVGLRVIDVSDPTKPHEVGSCTNLRPGWVAVHGEYAYVAEGRGLAVPRLHSLRLLLGGRVRRRGLELVTRYSGRDLAEEATGSPQVPGESPLSVCTCSATPTGLHAPDHYGVAAWPLVCEQQRLLRLGFRRSIAWLSDSLSTYHRVRYLPAAQDSLPAAGQALPDGLSTRKIPTKGFKVASLHLIPLSQASWHNHIALGR